MLPSTLTLGPNRTMLADFTQGRQYNNVAQNEKMFPHYFSDLRKLSDPQGCLGALQYMLPLRLVSLCEAVRGVSAWPPSGCRKSGKGRSLNL